MSLISVPDPFDAYNAESSTLGGSNENEDSTQRQALGDGQHP